jgi:two-component system, NarL family, invasion response regulator UvrY
MPGPDENNTNVINILITDDHPLIRQSLRRILEDSVEASLIEEAGSGSELMAKIHEQDFDVILLDISLPGKSGLEILKDIRKLNPGINVLIVSIYPIEQYGLRAMTLGASGYITKADAPDELANAIRKVMAGEKYFNTCNKISDTLN